MKKTSKYCALLLVFCLVMPLFGCSAPTGEDPDASAAPTLAKPVGNYTTGGLFDLSLLALQSSLAEEGNRVISLSGLEAMLCAGHAAAAGDTRTALQDALGAQGVSDALLYQTQQEHLALLQSYTAGTYLSAWDLLVFENISIQESFIQTMRAAFGQELLFRSLDADSCDAFYDNYVDDVTYSRSTAVSWQSVDFSAPVLLHCSYFDPAFSFAQDPARTLPVPFYYEDGSKSALSMMPVVQESGLYRNDGCTVAILPTANNETRLIFVLPGEEMTWDALLLDLQQNWSTYLQQADWGEHRVVIPKLSLHSEGSSAALLAALGAGTMLQSDGDLSTMGRDLYFADAYHQVHFELDETGLESAPAAPAFRVGVDDGIETLLLDRAFLLFVQDSTTGLVHLCALVRDPLYR